MLEWISHLYHVLNNHDWLLRKCDHEPLTGPIVDSNGVHRDKLFLRTRTSPKFVPENSHSSEIAKAFACLYQVEVFTYTGTCNYPHRHTV